MRLTALVLLAFAVVTSSSGLHAASADPSRADKVVGKLLGEEGVKPGGVFRLYRCPIVLAKGFSVAEDTDVYEDRVQLEAKEPSFLYFANHRDGAMYQHPVEYLLVTVKRRKVTRARARWWPVVQDAKGRKVTELDGTVIVSEKGKWFSLKENRLLGDDGTSIGEAQQAARMDWMIRSIRSKLPKIQAFMCPRTLQKGDIVWSRDPETKEPVKLASVSEESFVVFGDLEPGKKFPHDCVIQILSRGSKELVPFDSSFPPRLTGADGEEFFTDDCGMPLPGWEADGANGFFSQTRLGGKR